MLTINADPALHASGFARATPFPHIVLDQLFDDGELRQLLDNFPSPADTEWVHFDGPTEKKLGYHHEFTRLPQRLQWFLFLLNSHWMLSFLEKLTGIQGLIPDPYFGGGGIHQILPGGFLKIHADFNWHPLLRLDRRLNLLIYLNDEWRDEYGGHLELWSKDMTRCERKIAPLFNRTVIFATNDHSYHGHPAPLTCPPGRTRKSISLYYYSNGRPLDEQSSPHDTLFQETPKT